MEKVIFCYRCEKNQIFTDKLKNGKNVPVHCSHCGVNESRNRELMGKMMTGRWVY